MVCCACLPNYTKPLIKTNLFLCWCAEFFKTCEIGGYVWKFVCIWRLWPRAVLPSTCYKTNHAISKREYIQAATNHTSKHTLMTLESCSDLWQQLVPARHVNFGVSNSAKFWQIMVLQQPNLKLQWIQWHETIWISANRVCGRVGNSLVLPSCHSGWWIPNSKSHSHFYHPLYFNEQHNVMSSVHFVD